VIATLAHHSAAEAGGYAGSVMYAIAPEHRAGLVAAALVPVAAWLVRRSDDTRARALVDGYRRTRPLYRLVAWLLALSGALHLGLVFGHEPSALSVLFAADGVLLLVVAHRLVTGRRWRPWAGLVLAGSIGGFMVAGLSGQAPDQVALATKLAELVALVATLTPPAERRLRRAAVSVGFVSLTVLTGVTAWAGAFVAAGDGGHHAGATPMPGTLLPPTEDRAATPDEAAAAAKLHRAIATAIAPFADTSVAEAVGYQVGTVRGIDHHAPNPRFQHDGRIFDPSRPETLVYAVGPDGPVLLGAMFEMDGLRRPGPTPGGPLTVWHAHDHICITPLPPFFVGIMSPFGGCPNPSVTLPMTPEMIHVWTIPGAPEPFGHLDEAWIRDHLSS
jgi:hypothetical protein